MESLIACVDEYIRVHLVTKIEKCERFVKICFIASHLPHYTTPKRLFPVKTQLILTFEKWFKSTLKQTIENTQKNIRKKKNK